MHTERRIAVYPLWLRVLELDRILKQNRVRTLLLPQLVQRLMGMLIHRIVRFFELLRASEFIQRVGILKLSHRLIKQIIQLYFQGPRSQQRVFVDVLLDTKQICRGQFNT